MEEFKSIPVIDLFAGPGGLGEGFSSVKSNDKYFFDIKLSIEKDPIAHETLKLRSFYRKFLHKGLEIPEEYYDLLREPSLKKREKLLKSLYAQYPEVAKEADVEARKIELGSDNYPALYVDARIKNALGEENKHWVLIGGPPCQAFSLVGRSRVGGVHETDHRVYLYKEYLRIIANHHPSVFIMENVKGLLSAQVNGEKVFDWMLRDLQNPASVFKNSKSPKYTIYSLAKTDIKDHKDYLIKAEKYSIPQKRHRVILIGVREDVNVQPEVLKEGGKVTLESVIGSLPALRSALSRDFIKSEIVEGRKKRIYEKLEDSETLWNEKVRAFRNQLLTKNEFGVKKELYENMLFENGIGAEFIECANTIAQDHPLYKWYSDPKLGGVINHESRSHLLQDIKRYLFASMYSKHNNKFPRMADYAKYDQELLPDHESASTGKFADRFRVQLPDDTATTVTSHISKDGHYFIHYDPKQCRSLTVREAARIQTFPDNYLFWGGRTSQFHQVGNAVPPYLAKQIGDIVRDLFLKMEDQEINEQGDAQEQLKGELVIEHS
ncbi:DNA (cytosine-5-)-methyltransferase [Nibribacter ruber]|uniref:DNA (cytosine-5-)-methyltransferase n=1 Tax=Nibribacter ruber TaxID=2698458 RepID=A0A6P1P0L8_9BACT|nr:DNA (cytosine-5-)-methyltransferase [Nibribacter ruber]QHL88229.1 DNA (cytosine-5-)-methyltransferase [Nibribacter ruber]